MSPEQALDIKFYSQDLYEVVTIRDYFKRMLMALWDEGEGFSGKRPLGNSGWEADLQAPLVHHGCIAGTVHAYDDEGEEPIDYDPTHSEHNPEVDGVNDTEYYIFVDCMIEAL